MSLKSPVDETPLMVDGRPVSSAEEKQALRRVSGSRQPSLNQRRFVPSRTQIPNRSNRSPRSPSGNRRVRQSPVSPLDSHTRSPPMSAFPTPESKVASVQSSQTSGAQPGSAKMNSIKSESRPDPTRTPAETVPVEKPVAPQKRESSQRKKALLDSLQESEIPDPSSPVVQRSPVREPPVVQRSPVREPSVVQHVGSQYGGNRHSGSEYPVTESSYPEVTPVSSYRSQFNPEVSQKRQDLLKQLAELEQTPSRPERVISSTSDHFRLREEQLRHLEAENQRKRDELRQEHDLRERAKQLEAERQELQQLQQEQTGIAPHSTLHPPPLGSTQGVIITSLRKRRAGMEDSEEIDFSSMSPAELRKFEWELNQNYEDMMRLFPNYNIPKGMLQQPLEIRHAYYLTYQRRTMIDAEVQKMKWKVVGMIILAEVVTTKLFKLPAKDFAVTELASMAEYEMNLRIIAERGFTAKIQKETNPMWAIVKTMTVNLILYTLVTWFLGSAGSTVTTQLISKIKTAFNGQQVKIPGAAATTEADTSIPAPAAPNQGGGFDGIMGMFSKFMGVNTTKPTPQNPVDDTDLPDFNS